MSSKLTDVFASHPLYLHQEHPDDFKSLHELPDQYKWTRVHEYPSLDSPTLKSVTIIDLNDPNAIQLIGHACKTWGIFQVTNHGVPQKLVDDIESATRCLFTLPMEQKLKAARPPTGFSGYGFHRISAFCEKLMWSEGFTIVGSPLEHFHQLWPEDYLKFCSIFEEYEKEMKKLAERLMWLMLGSLGVFKEDVKWANPNSELEAASAALQLNSYPACPNPDQAMGLVDHTDSNLLSIVHQGNISGLQVLRDGGWIMIPPIPSALVINVGDLIHILSNGLYHNVFHRAVVNRTHHRVSVAYLYGPPISAEISPLSKLVGPSHPPLYPSVTWKEYLGIKAKFNNKTLLSLRLDDTSPK
ncbi:putative gibberellin 3-beta-dioxygenase [Rosa chinensis]|uniref:gibberellin 3beta-dioxygenase n=1 Tax=Rosa chinensis TaxID=74649 RepID=A0A2P6PGY4_ROSCH|nr:gibberellin 3-beta-dioxygenase 1 [Rosa chinensis]PRQ21177.1 putative gibberellin 3-beta-dioxygenase [Rosa chinensis]